MLGVPPSTNRNSKPHWYRQYLGECPVCGSDKSYKERVYGQKPASPSQRYVQLSQQETFDWCV
jgi:hypothetical protein